MRGAEPGDRPLRVLVVEDNADLNGLIRAVIERCGCVSEAALSGAAAVAALDREPPDLVVLDYNLPDMRVEDILGRIAQMDPRPEVIVATGHGNERIAADMVHHGARDYIIKDARFHERLTASVRETVEALRRRRAADRAREELEAREHRFHDLYEEAPLPYQSLDAEGRIVAVNQEWLKLLGYERDEVMGRRVTDFLDESSAAHFPSMFETFGHEGRVDGIEVGFVARSGERMLARVFGRIIRDEQGAFVRTQCILQDITALRRAEEAARRLEEDYRRIVETCQEGIWVIDSAMRTTFVNPRMCEILGYTEAEIEHKPITDFLLPEDLADLRERMQRRMRGESERYERRLRAADGSIKWFMVSATPIMGDDGSFQGACAMFSDITERKRSERALKDAVDRWQRTFDAVPDMICVLDREQRIVAANAAMAERLGRAPDEILGKHCYELMHPQGAPPDVCPFLRLDEGGTQSADMQELALGGTFHVTVTPILDAEGIVVGGVHVVRDITERVEAQRETQRSRDFLNRIIDAVADPIFVKDSQHRWILVNDAECRLIGVSREAMLGKTDYDLFPEDQAQTFWEGDDEVLGTGHTSSRVEDITDASGNVRTLITSKALHVGPDNQQYVVGVSKDITELIDAQNGLQRSRRQLESLFRLAQQQFETETALMDYALDEAVRLSGSEVGYAHFMRENEVDLTLFAWSSRARELCMAPAEGKYPLNSAGVWADCARLKRPVIHNDYEGIADRKGLPEGHVPIRRHMSVPVMEGDRVVMIAGVGNKAAEYDETDAHDLHLYMTEVWHLLRRRQAEIELRKMNAELAERVRERTAQLETMVAELNAFAYSVSHDLRAPARQAGQFAEILDQDYGAMLDHDGQRYIARIREAASRMNQLIDALLTLSRTARSELQPEKVDLSALASEILDAMRQAEPERRVTTQVEPGIVAHCDRRLVHVVLQNLLGNAWKFTSKQPTACIEFGSMDRDGRRVFYVRDGGAGFDMTYAQRLFGAFQRYHADGEFPGHGIGLANVQRAVRRHGGEIWAESAVGKGATFYFTLEG